MVLDIVVLLKRYWILFVFTWFFLFSSFFGRPFFSCLFRATSFTTGHISPTQINFFCNSFENHDLIIFRFASNIQML
jgi:hypothetical protein